MSQTINEDALLRISQVLELIPISRRSAWWQGCKSGKYPKPIKIGPKTTVWKASDIAKTLRELTGEQKKRRRKRTKSRNENCPCFRPSRPQLCRKRRLCQGNPLCGRALPGLDIRRRASGVSASRATGRKNAPQGASEQKNSTQAKGRKAERPKGKIRSRLF